MLKFFTIFLSFIFFSFSAFSKDYKIEELLNIAEQNSANIKAAEYSALSQQHFADQQKYWSNPNAGFERLGKENTYSVTQAIPFAGKLQKKYNIEEAEFRVQDVRKNNLTLFVKAEIFSLIYKYQSLSRKIELTQKRLDRLLIIDKYLSAITLNSPTKRAQGHITKNKIKLVERDLIKFKNEFSQIWNSANIYLQLGDRPTNIILKWLDGKNYSGRDFFINSALENNLELKEQQILINKYKAELSYSKIEQMPDLNVMVSRRNSSASGANQDSSGAGLSVSIPLLNRNQGQIAAAKSKIKSQEFAYEFQRNKLIGLINNDINEFETSLKLANNFPISNIDKILSHLGQANNDFKKGVLDFITYIELDTQEYQTIYTILDTQEDLAAAYAQLMIKTGNFTLPKND